MINNGHTNSELIILLRFVNSAKHNESKYEYIDFKQFETNVNFFALHSDVMLSTRPGTL